MDSTEGRTSATAGSPLGTDEDNYSLVCGFKFQHETVSAEHVAETVITPAQKVITSALSGLAFPASTACHTSTSSSGPLWCATPTQPPA